MGSIIGGYVHTVTKKQTNPTNPFHLVCSAVQYEPTHNSRFVGSLDTARLI